VFTNVDLVALGGGKRLQSFTSEKPTIVTDGFVSLAFKNSNPKVDSTKLSGIEKNFLSPHLALSVANGPYIVTDVFNRGSAMVQLDGSFSHTHGTGLHIVEWHWTKGSTVIATGSTPNVTLPVGEHTIYLEVKDTGNSKGTDTTTVTVNRCGYPVVLGIEPAGGGISGGQLVTISGSGFDQVASAIKVKFGMTKTMTEFPKAATGLKCLPLVRAIRLVYASCDALRRHWHSGYHRDRWRRSIIYL
jgi:IPT/TIG domain